MTMTNKFLAMMALIILFLAGCGTLEQPSQAVQDSEGGTGSAGASDAETQAPDSNEVDTSLNKMEMDASMEQADGAITFNIEIINNNDEAVTLKFSSGQQYEITVENEKGEKVYQLSDSKAFADAIVEQVIDPSDKLTWTEGWDEPALEPGTYTVNYTLLPDQVNQQTVEANLFQIESTFDVGQDSSDNSVFRNVKVNGQAGKYTITGEVQASSSEFYYNVEDGHNMLVEETKVEVESKEAWNSFELEISISDDILPTNGTLTLVLYEKSIDNGGPTSSKYLPLDRFQ
ncbi:BsuPI-related putative proteinase inhibitor [Aquibacillus salsiterrae]|uniref:Intracellular proteinase inhibitor BsuPI domain-containing protein n=1 Tax=Aquibacillus salsiterrae TaxID=2950439 RepID=A0A9X3WCE1_9BACI|nr:BsuPI-related putative proteinase inhibitor [Aquibacillus salsiterrae]MDC3417227.1 BsuPI-related putative proteinase inhibitor [Aquibacillus salsiterrae]